MVNILLLGLISFFSDISAEMVYPLIPLYLTSAFGATPALVGLIEGLAESLASLLKVFSGYVTDKYRHKKRVAFLGYSTGLIYKIALLAAGSWAGVLAARVIDRVGKGIRTAPRDVMVSESAEEGRLGHAFGVHKALDMAGSALGILLAYLLLGQAGTGQYRAIFRLSLIPAVLGLLLFGWVKEKKDHGEPRKREPFWKRMGELDGQLKLYLAVAFLFTLGNSSNGFLLLKAKAAGFTDRSVILLYFLYNLTAALLSIPLGKRSDRVGRKRVLVAGYGVFALVYLGFARATQPGVLTGLFVLYGVYSAMTAGVERAFIAEIAPSDLKGTMLGAHGMLVGLALFPASAVAGLLWNYFGASAPFYYGAVLSLLSAVILQLFLRKKGEGSESPREGR